MVEFDHVKIMKEQIIESLLALISGCLLGLSSGLGFWPKYEQPKNIRIQTVLGIIGLVFLILMCMSCEKERQYIIKYKVYYPKNVVVKTKKCLCTGVRVVSINGTNDILCKVNCGNKWIESTTAPIEVISIK